jgi:alcohol dehydrogenase class IV
MLIWDIVEALYAPDTNPIIQLLAIDGIRNLAQALPTIKTDPLAS